MIKNKNKVIILSSMILGILFVGLGITYSLFTFNRTGSRKSELVTGDIYMHYVENNGINLQNAFPKKDLVPYVVNENATNAEIAACANYFHENFGDEGLLEGENWNDYCSGSGTWYDATFQEYLDDRFPYEVIGDLVNLNIINPVDMSDALSDYAYFEFTIDGKNTHSEYDVNYDVTIVHGDNETGKERIEDQWLRFALVEVVPNGQTETINFLSWNMDFWSIANSLIYRGIIPKNTTTQIDKTYRLYMWISDEVGIGTENVGYTIEEWNNLYASIKVNVNGYSSNMTPNYLIKTFGYGDQFWPDSIYNVADDITEVNFVKLSESEINQRYANAAIKKDVTDPTPTKGGRVLAWLEVDNEDPTKYKMYVASNGITYFPEDSSDMFYGWENLKTINFQNIDTRQVVYMRSMFDWCSSLTNLDLSNFDTSQVVDMQSMFNNCSSLPSLNVSNFNTSNVTTMQGMFCNCSSLTNLDLSNFDTSNLFDPNEMFVCPK